MSPQACEAMRRNVEYNHVQAIEAPSTAEQPNVGPVARGKGRRKFHKTGVVVNEGDAKYVPPHLLPPTPLIWSY